MTGCASSKPTPESAAASEPNAGNQLGEIRTLLTSLSGRLDQLEGKFSALNGKMDQLQNRASAPARTNLPQVGVHGHPSDGHGVSVSASTASNDPEGGFANDEPVQAYRNAQVLLKAGKYSEAVLAFSSFVERYPDHPLAGASQYFVGEAYFRQKEYKLALHELNRVLTSYDRSTHVAPTLRLLVEAEEALKMHQEAKRHRQLLTSLFPQSPAVSLSTAPEAVTSHVSSGSAAAAPLIPKHAALDEPPLTAPLGTPSSTPPSTTQEGAR